VLKLPGCCIPGKHAEPAIGIDQQLSRGKNSKGVLDPFPDETDRFHLRACGINTAKSDHLLPEVKFPAESKVCWRTGKLEIEDADREGEEFRQEGSKIPADMQTDRNGKPTDRMLKYLGGNLNIRGTR
jgi:hypothetical protein